ncbi:hypothetical protein KAZ92_00860 [Candidatus Gracilibacteria bacterium]|nr:hypothetical protein [Candidatus Gracilibacteria bacterium]
MINKYNRIARIYPAVLCSVPIFVLNYFYLHSYTTGLVGSLEGVRWVGGLTISVALTFLLAQIGRYIGKELYEKTHFFDELRMPTTQMLLHGDSTYSVEHKSKVHDKIFKDFGIRISTVSEEQLDDNHARKLIVECVSMIRGKVKDGHLLLQHNIEYGFIRNLIGGSVVSVFISICNLFIFGSFFKDTIAYDISLFTAVSYLLIISLGRFLIGRYGIRYAKVLIQEYLLL